MTSPSKEKAAPARTASPELKTSRLILRGSCARRNVARGSDTTRPQVHVEGVPAAVVLARDVRGAWVEWLAPNFTEGACYFTGTYCDEYGVANGLMLARNVHKDWRRFLDEFGFEDRWICGVEQHKHRDILHLHAILGGEWSDKQREWLKRWWQVDRGFARSLPVLDGCASYVTKYALKGDTDSFEWELA